MYYGIVNASKRLVDATEDYGTAVKLCVTLNKCLKEDHSRYECHVVQGLKNIMKETRCNEREIKSLIGD